MKKHSKNYTMIPGMMYCMTSWSFARQTNFIALILKPSWMMVDYLEALTLQVLRLADSLAPRPHGVRGLTCRTLTPSLRWLLYQIQESYLGSLILAVPRTG